MQAILALEDGTVFKGKAIGAFGERYGEIVFNTSMTGYQEIITDPSYKGQIVIMTYPLIGNYGVNFQDIESKKPQLEGLVIKELSRISSNWSSKKGLEQYLKENNILAIENIDTRALTYHIRSRGAMKAVLSTEDLNQSSLVKKAKKSPGLIGKDLVEKVSSNKVYSWNTKGRYKVVVIDCGIKFNILRHLEHNNCQVTVVPAKVTAEEILKLKPNGLLISNGPGDPAAVLYLIKNIRKLIKNKLPIFGICLGQQILALALGGKSYKLKFGHRGGNHPVKDLKTGKVDITSQNHGFCIKIQRSSNKKIKKYYMIGNKDIEITHINLNDETCEGIRHKKYPIFSVQFHPESGPGPHDANYIFGEFIKMMAKNR